MDKYQISRVLEVFDGSTFEGIINLGMGVYLKKKIFLSGIISPSINNENEKLYWLQARNKLRYYLRDTSSKKVYIHVNEYHDDYVYGDVYTNEFEDSLNWIMFLKGYVWDNGIELPEDNERKRETYVLNTPK
jgi:hypothetical protein